MAEGSMQEEPRQCCNVGKSFAESLPVVDEEEK